MIMTLTQNSETHFALADYMKAVEYAQKALNEAARYQSSLDLKNQTPLLGVDEAANDETEIVGSRRQKRKPNKIVRGLKEAVEVAKGKRKSRMKNYIVYWREDDYEDMAGSTGIKESGPWLLAMVFDAGFALATLVKLIGPEKLQAMAK